MYPDGPITCGNSSRFIQNLGGTTQNTPQLPRTPRILRTTTAIVPLTTGIPGCHKRHHGQHPRNPQCHLVAPDGRKIGVCAWTPGVAVLVSESREVMNVRQASQYLGISPDTLYRYITEGEIPAFKLGNRWKLRKTILDRWMERKMSQAHAKRR